MDTRRYRNVNFLGAALIVGCGGKSIAAGEHPNVSPTMPMVGAPPTTPRPDTSGWTWVECGILRGVQSTDDDRIGGTIGVDLTVTPYQSERTSGTTILFRGMTGPIRSLSVSSSGTEFVAHGQMAVKWELQDDFESSVPVWRTVGDGTSKVDVSPRGDFVAFSGDARDLHDATTGTLVAYVVPTSVIISPLFGTLARFSPDGKFVAGGGYDATVEVYSVPDLLPVFASKSAEPCPGVAFSKDGKLMVTSGPELFRGEGWERVWSGNAPRDPSSKLDYHTVDPYNWVELTPDETQAVVSNCDVLSNVVCRTTLHSMIDGTLLEVLPKELGVQPDISTSGDWVVAQDYLYHLPSRTLIQLDPLATVARFTPAGDIIGGRIDGSLVKYCRHVP